MYKEGPLKGVILKGIFGPDWEEEFARIKRDEKEQSLICGKIFQYGEVIYHCLDC